MTDQIGGNDQPVEGKEANKARLNRESLAKIFSSLDPNCQMIFISTDVTGATPTHVHMQGPSQDGVLIGGMLSEAGRIVLGTIDQQKKQLKLKVKELEERITLLEISKNN